MSLSKSLGIDDSSGFAFAKEMLAGDSTAAINFDRIQKDSNTGQYIIFEYLLCDEKQRNTTPYSSHPNKYWHLNSRKFISLCEVANKLNALLYLVNYAKEGTTHQDEILLMRVTNWTDKSITTVDEKYNRKSFSTWFRQQNTNCL